MSSGIDGREGPLFQPALLGLELRLRPGHVVETRFSGHGFGSTEGTDGHLCPELVSRFVEGSDEFRALCTDVFEPASPGLGFTCRWRHLVQTGVADRVAP